MGCAGGLWAIGLARNGFKVIGTDHHPGIIEIARDNAKKSGLEEKLTFLVDDGANSKLLPQYFCSRVICISVTPCLSNDAAFESLINHLDRSSRPEGSNPAERRVILGHNRWAPSRLGAVEGALEAHAGQYERSVNRLFLIESTWWMHPRHIDVIKKRFPAVTMIGKIESKIDGTRVDLLLQ